MTGMPTKRFAAVAAVAALALTTLVGCGGSSSTSASSTSGKGTTVTVQAGFIPVIDVAALYLGKDQGIFEKEGINLNVNLGTSGAAVVPAVVSGQYTFGFSAIVSLLQAKDQGVPLKIIAAGSSSTGKEGADVTMIHAAPSSGIKTPKDLEGKTVSVNALNGLLQLLCEVAVKKDGGDPTKVHFIELPFANAVSSLKAHKIDAMVGAEPFGTAAISAGFPAISSPYLTMSQDPMLTSAYYTSDAQLQKNPELFAKLGKAIDESLTYAQAHPDEVRAELPKFSGLSAADAQKAILPTYAPDVPESSISLFSQYAKEFGVTKKDVSFQDLVWSGAGK